MCCCNCVYDSVEPQVAIAIAIANVNDVVTVTAIFMQKGQIYSKVLLKKVFCDLFFDDEQVVSFFSLFSMTSICHS